MLCLILCAFTKFAVSKSNVVIRHLKFKEADFILTDPSTHQHHCAHSLSSLQMPQKNMESTGTHTSMNYGTLP